MWNRGMTLRHRSAVVSARDAAILLADAVKLAAVSGTIFGREVVPDVCRISQRHLCDDRNLLQRALAPCGSSRIGPQHLTARESADSISRQYAAGPIASLASFGLAWASVPASLILNIALAMFFAFPSRTRSGRRVGS